MPDDRGRVRAGDLPGAPRPLSHRSTGEEGWGVGPALVKVALAIAHEAPFALAGVWKSWRDSADPGSPPLVCGSRVPIRRTGPDRDRHEGCWSGRVWTATTPSPRAPPAPPTAMSAAPHAPASRSGLRPLTRRPRTGAALGRLLAGLVAIGGIVALVGLVAMQNGWLVLQRSGAAVPARLASAGDVTIPTVPGTPANAESANASSAAAAVGDSVVLPTLDPAYGDSGRAGAGDSTKAGGASDSVAGLGERPAGGRSSAPTVTATPAELTALRGQLKVPVRGIAASALRDDYEQARGGGSRQHEALDILAPRGTPVTAACDGRIVKLFDSQQGGLTIYQSDPSDRFVLLYGHLDRYEAGLQEGASVKQGQVIGYVGSSGNADPKAPHLHFVVARSADPIRWWSSGTPVNPFLLLKP